MQVQHNEECNSVVSAGHTDHPAPATPASTYYEDSEQSHSESDEMEENSEYDLIDMDAQCTCR